MYLDGLTANLPQLPLDTVIERKDNLVKSFDIFDKTVSLTADINFLWVITPCASTKRRHSSHYQLKLPKVDISTIAQIVLGANLKNCYKFPRKSERKQTPAGYPRRERLYSLVDR